MGKVTDSEQAVDLEIEAERMDPEFLDPEGKSRNQQSEALNKVSEGIVSDHMDLPANDGRVDAMRRKANELGDLIVQNIPPGRRRQLALTNLETASMYAVKAALVGDE